MSTDSHTHNRILDNLRRRWLAVATLFVLAIVPGFGLVLGTTSPATAFRWALLVSATIACELWILWHGLPDNHRPGEATLFPTLGAANGITLARGLAFAFLAGFIVVPDPTGWLLWLPALIYTLAAALDFVDGLVARLGDRATVLGETLDIEFDSLGFLIAISVAIWYGQLPLWYLLAGLYRYLFLAGIGWRRRRGYPVHDLTPSSHRRIVAALQVSFVAVVLWPIIDPATSRFAAIFFAIPLTLSFGRDWLVVSGRINPDSSGYKEAMKLAATTVNRWLAPLARLVAVVTAASLLYSMTATQPFFAGLGLLALLMLALGVLGRLASLFLLIPTVLSFSNTGLTWQNGLLLAALITILHIGTGAYSLLTAPEDYLLTKPAGSREQD
ncbi:MAG: CDP-alcohol phosphatidyltransferase family protein [Chloroflexota bacterium]|nr:CDP-alcohol phosphatidyltransferase family protein [Chloroflexota bacterium]